MPACPTCDTPIDPTHAPVARIVGAKVLTFCSAACADAYDPKAAAKPKPKPAPKPAPEAKAKAKATPAPAAKAKAKPAPAPEPAAAAAPVAAAIEPEEELDLDLSPPRRGRRVALALGAVVAIGGAALVALDRLENRAPEPEPTAVSSPSVETPKPKPEPKVEPRAAAADAAEPAVPAPEKLYRAAADELEKLRASPSARVARLAAMALARTGDRAALDALAKLLGSETSELNRIAMAKALARANDERGRRVLLSGLESRRRDVRGDAAIALIELGDDRGEKVLRSLMRLRNHKIAAAGELARAGRADAKKILEKIFADKGEDAESRMRAAVALGRAGDADVAPFLRKTLDDGRYRVGAAAALAALGDPAARDALAQQLGLNAMRVSAALALRRLGGDVDLAPLAVALTRDDEVTRVTAAEAILILTGTDPVAERN